MDQLKSGSKKALGAGSGHWDIVSENEGYFVSRMLWDLKNWVENQDI